LVGADILGDWQGGGYDSGYTQGSSKTDDATFRANMTLSGAVADRRLPMSTANQKQALVHI
jgi:molybdopterin-containing oxidoreductase family iron-sulfur binding subunit